MPFFCFVHQSFTNVKFFERHTGKHITDGQCVQNGIVEQICPKAVRSARVDKMKGEKLFLLSIRGTDPLKTESPQEINYHKKEIKMIGRTANGIR